MKNSLICISLSLLAVVQPSVSKADDCDILKKLYVESIQAASDAGESRGAITQIQNQIAEKLKNVETSSNRVSLALFATAGGLLLTEFARAYRISGAIWSKLATAVGVTLTAEGLVEVVIHRSQVASLRAELETLKLEYAQLETNALSAAERYSAALARCR